MYSQPLLAIFCPADALLGLLVLEELPVDGFVVVPAFPVDGVAVPVFPVDGVVVFTVGGVVFPPVGFVVPVFPVDGVVAFPVDGVAFPPVGFVVPVSAAAPT